MIGKMMLCQFIIWFAARKYENFLKRYLLLRFPQPAVS